VTPAARVQAAIELLDLIIASAREGGAAADNIIATWFKTRRYAGSKDRRAVRDHVYAAIRAFGMMPKTGRMAMIGLAKGDKVLGECFDGSPYGPPKIGAGEQRVAKSPLAPWLGKLIDPAEHEALLGRAPLDLRVNTLRAQRADVLEHFEGAAIIEGLSDAIRLADNVVVENLATWRDGFVEVQDAGSQLIALACGAQRGQTVIDLCAGAGGKTLALAAAMGNEGRLIATDTNRERIQRLPPRAERAGATMIQTHLLNPGEEDDVLGAYSKAADTVLVDAPCSGSGTWRRNPEARWRLTPERLAAVVKTQAHVMSVGARATKPGGTLIYAVCSLIEAEGPGQVTTFLSSHGDWRVQPLDLPFGRRQGPGWTVSPAQDGCDGFFIARLERSC
jgi:16S rRNA (cytosine967-C5)-methyltransferase